METWKPLEVITSHWKKTIITPEGPVTIPLKLIRAKKVDEFGEVKWFYSIACPRNPLPVMGEFITEYRIIVPFLKKEGFVPNLIMPKEVIKYQYIN